ncbi:MAG: ribonuclease III [Thermoanaerobaculia bacterium]
MDKNLPFIHPSYANEKNLKEDNQRLEFLGDSLLGFIVSEYLYENFKEEREGFLSHLKSQLVSTETLASFAKILELDKKLFLSNGEEKNGGREKQRILADTFEAYIAYIYLKKGIKKAKKILEELLDGAIKEKKELFFKLDPKSYLQQICQRKNFPLPEYRAEEPIGPAHSPTFFVEVLVEGKVLGKGEGTSKKEAEQRAAEEAIKKIENDGRD